MDSNTNKKLTNEEINQLTKSDKYNYYVSQVDPKLLESWRVYFKIYFTLLEFKQN
jgi:hypothetical protein